MNMNNDKKGTSFIRIALIVICGVIVLIGMIFPYEYEVSLVIGGLILIVVTVCLRELICKLFKGLSVAKKRTKIVVWFGWLACGVWLSFFVYSISWFFQPFSVLLWIITGVTIFVFAAKKRKPIRNVILCVLAFITWFVIIDTARKIERRQAETLVNEILNSLEDGHFPSHITIDVSDETRAKILASVPRNYEITHRDYLFGTWDYHIDFSEDYSNVIHLYKKNTFTWGAFIPR